MKRIYPFALAILLLGGVGVLVECSGSVCGNGVVESGEQCDNGKQNGAPNSSCSASCGLTSIARASIQVSYSRLNVMVPTYPGYPAPTCMDLGIDSAHVVLTGPSAVDEKLPCDMAEKLYDPVTPGTYQLTVTLLDAQGMPLTKPVSSAMVDVKVASTPTMINVDFDIPDYLKSYTGNFDFLASWGADNIGCSQASPAVAKQTLTLTLPGSSTPVAAMTNDGEALDGTQFNCFQPTAAPKYQEVKNLTWGHYDLTITGESGPPMKMLAYCQKFDVFVGVGVAVPTYALTVGPLAPMDDGGGDGGTSCP